MPDFKMASQQDNPKDKDGKTKRDREHEAAVKKHGSADLPPNAPENQRASAAADTGESKKVAHAGKAE